MNDYLVPSKESIQQIAKVFSLLPTAMRLLRDAAKIVEDLKKWGNGELTEDGQKFLEDYYIFKKNFLDIGKL